MFRQNDYESMDSTYSLRFYGIKELRCDLHVMDDVPYIYTIFTHVCLHIHSTAAQNHYHVHGSRHASKFPSIYSI